MKVVPLPQQCGFVCSVYLILFVLKISYLYEQIIQNVYLSAWLAIILDFTFQSDNKKIIYTIKLTTRVV